MTLNCPVCGTSKNIHLRPYKSLKAFFKGLNICRCSICGLDFADPMPNKKDWYDFNSAYHEEAHGGIDLSENVINYNNAIAKVRINHIKKHLENLKITVSTVLEIGPGHGYFLKEWCEMHPKTEYWVKESDTSLFEGLIGNGALINGYQNKILNKKVDLVIISHVLEHSISPVAFLLSAIKNLKKGGLVFIEVPCLDYLYKSVNDPHLLFFDKQSLETCLKKIGLEEIVVTYHGDKIINIKLFNYLKRVFVKLQRVTGVPFCYGFLGSWPNKRMLRLTHLEALSIVQTAPQKSQEKTARWLRAIGRRSI